MSKKLIASIVIALLLVTQLVPVGASATTSDVRVVLEELNSLKVQHEAEVSSILGKIWEYAALENGGNGPVTAEKVYAGIRDSFDDSSLAWTDIVHEGTPVPSGDGKIEETSLIYIINKVLEHKSVIQGMYDSFKSTYQPFLADPVLKNVVRGLLSLDEDATDAEVYTAIMQHAGKVVTMDNNTGKFVRYGNAAKTILENIGITESVAQAVLGDHLATINGTIDRYAETLNGYIDQFKVADEDVIFALSIYGLYSAPVVVSPSPSPTTTPGGNPGGPGNAATPTPAPATDEKQLVENLNKAIDDIANEPDPAKALDKAISLISGAAAAMHELADKGLSIQSAIQALEKAANAALAKVNTVKVTSTVTAGKSTAVIDTAAANEMISKLDKIISTAKQLNAELAKASTDAKIEVVLNIKVDTGSETVTESSAQLPTTLLKAAAEKGIDKIAIDTGVASIAITPGAIAVGDQTSVTLSAAKVDKTSLSSEEQAAVGSNQVFEFKALAGTTSVTSFNKPVEIAVPYTLKSGESADKISVFFVNAQGQLENVIGAYDPATKTVTFSTPHFSKYIVKENKVIFSDLGKVEWARLNVESMAAKGIITGVPGGKFAPADSLTRAQFAALIVRTYKLEDAAAANTFSDVKAADWFYKPVMIAYKAGIVTGLTDGRFDPNGKVTREQMAAMVARALVKVKGKDLTADAGKYTAKFVDKGSISSFAANESNLVAKYGIMSGKPGDKFDPKGNASRVEAAVVMYRVFNVK